MTRPTIHAHGHMYVQCTRCSVVMIQEKRACASGGRTIRLAGSVSHGSVCLCACLWGCVCVWVYPCLVWLGRWQELVRPARHQGPGPTRMPVPQRVAAKTRHHVGRVVRVDVAEAPWIARKGRHGAVRTAVCGSGRGVRCDRIWAWRSGRAMRSGLCQRPTACPSRMRGQRHVRHACKHDLWRGGARRDRDDGVDPI